MTEFASTLPAHPLRTVREAADILRVSTQTVYRLVKRGHLPAFRLPSGAGIRISDRDLLTFVRVGMVR